MKRVFLVVILIQFILSSRIVKMLYGQISITEGGSDPHSSAMLHVEADQNKNKGVLIPRLTNVQRNSLNNPAVGLLIYNSDSKRLNYWDGSKWVEITSVEVSVSQASGSGVVTGIGITNDGSDPHHSAMLEVKGTTGGILIPRMTTTQRNLISSPADGLLIYNTETNRFNYYNGTSWLELCGTNVGSSTGSVQAGFGVSISLDGSDPHSSAILEVKSTTGGLLIPRLTNSQRNNIPSPAEGLWIYNIDSKTFQVYKGSGVWVDIGANTIPAPTASSATNVQQTSFTANWTASSGATGYYLDVATCSGFTGCYVSGYQNLNIGNVTSYNVTGLACNTTYYYRVRAYNSCGTSGNSNTITVTTSSCPPACGSQVFMLANMDVGTMVSDHSTGSDHSHQTNDSQIEKYCYNNNSASCATYGGLYEWAEAMQIPNTYNWNDYPTDYTCDPCGSSGRQGICPSGYHICLLYTS
ncbi:MAG: fibronectin type III domain-containing protein, partial [Bacteroidales bacterium]|nr:fibronectin type III domain-containing protein [Bacteroidales bacterium]